MKTALIVGGILAAVGVGAYFFLGSKVGPVVKKVAPKSGSTSWLGGLSHTLTDFSSVTKNVDSIVNDFSDLFG